MTRFHLYVPRIAEDLGLRDAHRFAEKIGFAHLPLYEGEEIEEFIAGLVAGDKISVGFARDILYVADLYAAERRRFPQIKDWSHGRYTHACSLDLHPEDVEVDLARPRNESEAFIDSFLDSLMIPEHEAEAA